MSRISLFVLGITLSGLAFAVAPPPKSNAQLIEELDDEEFDVRQRASAALISRDLRAATSLEKALLEPHSLEQRHRVRRALSRIYSQPRNSAEIRAVVALTGELRTIYSKSLTRELATVLDHVITRLKPEEVAKLRRFEAASEYRHGKAAPLEKQIEALARDGVHSGKEHDALVKDLTKLADEIGAIEKEVEAIYEDAFKRTNLKYSSAIKRREFGTTVSYRAGNTFQVKHGDRDIVVVTCARGFRAFEAPNPNNLLATPPSLEFFNSDAFADIQASIDEDQLTPQKKFFMLDGIRGRAGQPFYKVSLYAGPVGSDKPAVLALKLLAKLWKETPAAKLPTLAELPPEILEPLTIKVGKSMLIR